MTCDNSCFFQKKEAIFTNYHKSVTNDQRVAKHEVPEKNQKKITPKCKKTLFPNT